jgi:2-hydroxy-3-oxopropionate reductase
VQLAFIGLGLMGRPMAAGLLAAGHTMSLYDRSEVPLALLEPGGVSAASAAQAACTAEIMMIMAPDTPAVDAAPFGEDGIATTLSPGAVVIDFSSIHWPCEGPLEGVSR